VNEITRAALILGAVGLGLVAIRFWVAVRARSLRNSVSTESLRPWPAVVLFTSTDCDACEPVRDVAFACCPDGTVREVTYQGHSDLFRSAGIRKVPAIVVIDGQGEAVGAYEGQVTGRRLASALGRAGIQ
jgi:hypothetical protein